MMRTFRNESRTDEKEKSLQPSDVNGIPNG